MHADGDLPLMITIMLATPQLACEVSYNTRRWALRRDTIRRLFPRISAATIYTSGRLFMKYCIYQRAIHTQI